MAGETGGNDKVRLRPCRYASAAEVTAETNRRAALFVLFCAGARFTNDPPANF